MQDKIDVIVLGGGIAGLTAAHRTSAAGLSTLVIEQNDSLGGSIRTLQDGPHIFEGGPNTIQRSNAALETLIDELGLETEIMEADAQAANRYVVRNNRPVRVPGSPAALLTTELFSWKARASLLREPFVRPSNDASETVADFVRRRLNPEFLDYGVEPFVAGVFAGDAERLAVDLAFPRMKALEREHRSLIRGAMSRRRRRSRHRSKWTMFSFRGGLGRLPQALVDRGGFDVQVGAEVESIRRGNDGFWTVETTSGDFRSRSLVWTLPLTDDAPPIHTAGPTLPVPVVEYAPVAVVASTYTERTILHPLDGFGMLVPRVETSTRILGTLFTSSIFPERVKDDSQMLTTFVGGTRHPHHVDLPDRDLTDLVHADNTRLLGITSAPRKTVIVRWPRAIPQYNLGYEHALARLDELEQDLEGLVFAGNFRAGISVPDTVESARAAAERVVMRLLR